MATPTREAFSYFLKLSAVLNRSKGRNFYDAMFLLSQTKPNYTFLTVKHGLHNGKELKEALRERIAKVDLAKKQQDVQHLLFDSQRTNMIPNFSSFIQTYDWTPTHA